MDENNAIVPYLTEQITKYSSPQLNQEAYQKDHLIIVETVYHQPFNEQPSCVENRFHKILETNEQPCIRKMLATSDWQEISGVWLEQVSMLVISNDEGKHFRVIPTEEEKAEVNARVIEIGISSVEFPEYAIPVCTVHPGESSRFAPIDLKAIRIRCRKEKARYTLSLFPV